MTSAIASRLLFSAAFLAGGLAFSSIAFDRQSRSQPAQIMILGQMADPTGETFHDDLMDRMFETLNERNHPAPILSLVWQGKQTIFWVGLANADAQGNHFFVSSMGKSGKRLIVRSPDEDRNLAGGLTTPIVLGCGYGNNLSFVPSRLEPGEVSPVVRCKGSYEQREGIEGFVDVVAVPWAQNCENYALCIQKNLRKSLTPLLEAFRKSEPQFDSLILPAITTGNGTQSAEFFYEALQKVYVDEFKLDPTAYSSLVLPVYEADWKDANQTVGIQSSLASCLQRIALAWKQGVDARITVEKKRQEFLCTLAGLFFGVALIPLLIPTF